MYFMYLNVKPFTHWAWNGRWPIVDFGQGAYEMSRQPSSRLSDPIRGLGFSLCGSLAGASVPKLLGTSDLCLPSIWGRGFCLFHTRPHLQYLEECLQHSVCSIHFCEMSGWMFILTQTQPPSCQHLGKRKARCLFFSGLITVYRNCCLLYACWAHCEDPININWWTRNSGVWLQPDPSTVLGGTL